MSLKQFTQKDNIIMLWDVISDEDIFTFLTPDIQEKIYQLFINNIQGFFESEKNKNNSLIDINKKYIMIILNHIKNTYPYKPNKIKIYNEPPNKESITYEEIQNDRRSQFEKDYIKRQEEFEDSMTIKAPVVPEFADTQTDRPIKEMDKILKEIQIQRNYEVEQINRTYNSSSEPDNWLKPQETSLKNEKLGNNELKEKEQNNRRFKFLNELENNVQQLSPKKIVSFSESNEIKTFLNEDEEEDTIFSKLKKIDNQDNEYKKNTQYNQDNQNNQDKQYKVKLEISEDRIEKLERNVNYLNEKMDKILDILSK